MRSFTSTIWVESIGGGVRMSSFVGWELRATLAGLLEDFNLSRLGVGLDQ
jgi:hypothetical protein